MASPRRADRDDLRQRLRQQPRATFEAIPDPVVRTDAIDAPGVWYECGDPSEVLIGVDGPEVTVAEPKVTWLSQHPQLGLGRVHLRAAAPPPEVLARAIERASRRRRSTFRQCEICEETLPPESMLDLVCHGCASEHHGVVF